MSPDNELYRMDDIGWDESGIRPVFVYDLGGGLRKLGRLGSMMAHFDFECGHTGLGWRGERDRGTKETCNEILL